MIERAEIMRPARVVVGREGVERPHLLKDRVAVGFVEREDSTRAPTVALT